MTNKRAAIAAPVGGLEFQYLATWCEVLAAVADGSDVGAITIEADDAGNVDDIVVERTDGSALYIQVKHAMAGSSACDTDYLTATTASTKRSILQKLLASYQQLAGNGRAVRLQLLTDRQLHPDDLMLGCLDIKTSLLVPAATEGGARTDLGKARQGWIDHLGCSDDELIAFLEHTQFRTGESPARFEEIAGLRARTLGFDPGGSSDAGRGYVREWIQEHSRTRSIDDLRAHVDALLPRVSDQSLVVVNAIDRLTPGADPVWSFDWVDLFDGASAGDRRDLSDPADWVRRIGPELTDAASALRQQGRTTLLVRFAARQAVTFLVGAHLRGAAGFDLTFQQHQEQWSTLDAGDQGDLPVAVDAQEIGQGDEVAVVLGVAQSALDDVAAYVSTEGLPVSAVFELREEGPASRYAITTPQHACALARSLVTTVLRLQKERQASHIHLFLAGPGALAGLIGHGWNTMRPTTAYEHDGGTGYTPTLTFT